MTRLLLLGALAALVSGCAADARGYLTADQCWEDRECRREWRAEERTERRKAWRSRHHHEGRHKRRKLETIHAGGWERSRDGGAICAGLVVATGERAQSVENAQIFALRIWRGQVAFRYGESYTDFHKAMRPQVHCAPVGIADSISGKISEKFLGVTHYRCELRGIPCRGRPEAVQRDD